DTFRMEGFLTATDRIDGGEQDKGAADTLVLAGNTYSAGLTFLATTAINIEKIVVEDGFTYKLTLADATNGGELTVDGSALSGTNGLILNASAETTGKLTAIGGAWNDSLVGGAGADTFRGGAGADTLIGGTGIDTASYAGSALAVAVNL